MRLCPRQCFFFFFNDTATTEIYTLSLHDALPIYECDEPARHPVRGGRVPDRGDRAQVSRPDAEGRALRSEEHTSELQSPCNLVCRLLLEKKKKLDPNSAPNVTDMTSRTLSRSRAA